MTEEVNDADGMATLTLGSRTTAGSSIGAIFDRTASVDCHGALAVAAPVYAQGAGGSPWENAVQVLQTAFTSTIARGLSLVAIVVGGLLFAFGEGQSKRVLAGIIFGVGMSIGAVNFMAWLFP